MCDYSLHANPNRLAREGEQLVTHRFPTHSMGLASPDELDANARPDAFPKTWAWKDIKEWARMAIAGCPRTHAVCIPPGARLRLHDIDWNLQRELGVSESEEVEFVQFSASAYTYRDGVRFNNGKQLLLQRLQEGQRVDIVSLGFDGEATMIEDHEPRRETTPEMPGIPIW